MRQFNKEHDSYRHFLVTGNGGAKAKSADTSKGSKEDGNDLSYAALTGCRLTGCTDGRSKI